MPKMHRLSNCWLLLRHIKWLSNILLENIYADTLEKGLKFFYGKFGDNTCLNKKVMTKVYVILVHPSYIGY